jgi:O-antigen/teichoic acid export membrane protein
MREPLTVKAVVIFFLPLILMMELHQLSHATIQAFLARLANPMLVLAAFSIAYSFNNMISCIIQSSIPAGISFIASRNSFWHLFRFYCLIAAVPFVFIMTTAMTPLGNMIFGGWIGASAEVVKQTRIASAIMAFWIYPILIRNFAFAFAFINKRTILITYATVVRLASLGLFLLIFPLWLKGAAVGGTALVSCMTVESIYMVIVTYPYFSKLPRYNGTRVAYRDMWRFSWPLMIAQITENGVAFIINLFLGQLSKPDLAIAAFGVVNALVKVVLSPLKNMVQTVQALMHSREDVPVLLKFAAGLQLIFVGIIFGVFYTPLRALVLEGVMGLTLELSHYLTPGVKMIFIVAIFWGFSAVFRGMLVAIRSTFAIAVTAGIRLIVIAVVGSTTLFFPNLNGAVVGVMAMGSAFTAESLVLGWRLYVQLRKPGPLFTPLEA